MYEEEETEDQRAARGRIAVSFIIFIIILGGFYFLETTRSNRAREKEIAAIHASFRQAVQQGDWRAADEAYRSLNYRGRGVDLMARLAWTGMHQAQYGKDLLRLRRFATGRVSFWEWNNFHSVNSLETSLQDHRTEMALRDIDLAALDEMYGAHGLDSLVASAEVAYTRALLQKYRDDGVCGEGYGSLKAFYRMGGYAWNGITLTKQDSGWGDRWYSPEYRVEAITKIRPEWITAVGSTMTEAHHIHEVCDWPWDLAEE